jgi:hypothetical protein
MDRFIDRLARRFGNERLSRRGALSRGVQFISGVSVASVSLAKSTENVEAACGCGGCYTDRSTSLAPIIVTADTLNVRAEPYTCSAITWTISCGARVTRAGYTDQGSYVCNCCGHCSSRWYRLYGLAGENWVSSVWTDRNDNGCNCCETSLATSEAVG